MFKSLLNKKNSSVIQQTITTKIITKKIPMTVGDIYMLSDDELPFGSFRLLETDKRIFLPVETEIRVLVTSTDVIHAFAIPSFGIKIDAVPGRLNQAALIIERLGVFYGQCSELCGLNHGFMPIVVQSVVELQKSKKK